MDAVAEHRDDGVLLVVTSRPAGPRDLLALGLDLRSTWFMGEQERHVNRGIRKEARALKGRCRAS